MPRCVDCSEYVAKLEWCKARAIHLNPRIVREDLPCSDFKFKMSGEYAVQEIKPAIKQVKKESVARREHTAEFDFPIFPYWLSQCIFSSLLKCGDMSLAYDLLLQDACPEFKKRLEQEKWWKNKESEKRK
jgi:hypothetical protein